MTEADRRRAIRRAALRDIAFRTSLLVGALGTALLIVHLAALAWG